MRDYCRNNIWGINSHFTLAITFARYKCKSVGLYGHHKALQFLCTLCFRGWYSWARSHGSSGGPKWKVTFSGNIWRLNTHVREVSSPLLLGEGKRRLGTDGDLLSDHLQCFRESKVQHCLSGWLAQGRSSNTGDRMASAHANSTLAVLHSHSTHSLVPFLT